MSLEEIIKASPKRRLNFPTQFAEATTQNHSENPVLLVNLAKKVAVKITSKLLPRFKQHFVCIKWGPSLD